MYLYQYMYYEFIAGAVSGFSQTVIGHPFDTIKIRYQSVDLYKNDKKKKYFSGILSPLISSIVTNSCIFGINNVMKKNHYNDLICGTVVGIAISPVVFFFDVIKNNKQVYCRNVTFYDIINSKGLSTTFIREPIAFSIYFYTYNKAKNNGFNTLLSVGFGGFMNWLITYPLDVIRNRQIVFNITFKDACSSIH